jgi:chorismate mutase/prephenate dehydratase
MSDDQLDALRRRIDGIDTRLQDLIAERVAVARDIAALKAKSSNDGNFHRSEREARVLRAALERNAGRLPEEGITRLFRELISLTLAAEGPLTIAYLGPQGTYTHSAALKHFGHSARFDSQPGIEDVFRAVETQAAHLGVVPAENSSEGAITFTLDRMLDTPLKICGEIEARVRHQLLARGTEMSKIARVAGHAQALAQCRGWLARHLPHAETLALSSNAEAARRAAEDETLAAVAGAEAAEIYGLNALATEIADDPANTTRFFVIGAKDAGVSGDDKTSLVVSARNRPGALYRLLEPLARHEVSLTRIESRPARTALWEYVFFIDIEGHAQDARIKTALEALEHEAAFFRNLGSYPRAIGSL